MNQSIETARRERIDAVLALAAPRVAAEQRPQIEAFAQVYLHHLDADDLAARTPEDLLGAMLSCWHFAAERTPGVTKLRVLSPTLAEHGWASRHTVIEMVNDDMPFLVDTATMEINRQGLTLHLIVHPVLVVQRDAQGRLQSLRPLRADEPDPQVRRESWMHVEVDRLVDPQLRAELAAGLERVLADVRAAVHDWRPMLAAPARGHRRAGTGAAVAAAGAGGGKPRLPAMAGRRPPDLARLPPPRPGQRPGRGPAAPGSRQRPGRAARAAAGTGDEPFPRRLSAGRSTGISASFAAVPAQARAMARAPTPLLLVTRSNTRSTVHRPGYSDYVGVKRYNAAGEVIGEHRFLGLFTSTAYSARVNEIPLLRRKVAAMAARAALPEAGTWPRRWSTSCRPIRATTCSRSATTSSTTRRWASCGRRAPAPAPVRLARPVRALRLLPGVRAARGLLDRAAQEVPGAS